MRVIAGTYRSRVLGAPPGSATRPTSDRLRETLFNVLAPRVEGALFLDLYAGSGAVGIEALSRGALHATFVESARPALGALRKNLATLGIAHAATVDERGVSAALAALRTRSAAFSLVYLDPPYEELGEYAATLAALGSGTPSLLAPAAIVVAEHRRRPASALDDRYGALLRYRVLEQGDAALSFFHGSEPAEE